MLRLESRKGNVRLYPLAKKNLKTDKLSATQISIWLFSPQHLFVTWEAGSTCWTEIHQQAYRHRRSGWRLCCRYRTFLGPPWTSLPSLHVCSKTLLQTIAFTGTTAEKGAKQAYFFLYGLPSLLPSILVSRLPHWCWLSPFLPPPPTPLITTLRSATTAELLGSNTQCSLKASKPDRVRVPSSFQN